MRGDLVVEVAEPGAAHDLERPEPGESKSAGLYRVGALGEPGDDGCGGVLDVFAEIVLDVGRAGAVLVEVRVVVLLRGCVTCTDGLGAAGAVAHRYAVVGGGEPPKQESRRLVVEDSLRHGSSQPWGPVC